MSCNLISCNLISCNLISCNLVSCNLVSVDLVALGRAALTHRRHLSFHVKPSCRPPERGPPRDNPPYRLDGSSQTRRTLMCTTSRAEFRQVARRVPPAPPVRSHSPSRPRRPVR
ncbi:pentapeptide repeat-containing protein [Cellulomonas sp. PSBB021]|uniref:pentapeptide repeat-containing protein n=1 Tax=Cellulomonas sp. PSBB021 TaxID=2003551 RepID=UPI0035113B73